jgi:N-acetylmuramoyl-L-alanine amidase
MVINTTKTAGRVLIEIALIVGRLLVGLILIVGRKVNADGKPKVAQLASWVKARSIIFIRKSIEEVKPLAIEAGQTSKALLIVTGTRLRTEGGPRAMYTAQLIKLRSIAFVRKLKEQQTTKSTENIVHDPSGQNYRPGTTTSKVSPEIILQKDRTLDVSDRLANEIKNKGITCHIVRETGSIQF